MRWDLARHTLPIALVCVAISMALVVMPFSAPASADTVAASEMLALNNQLRSAVGAPTVPSDARLAQAAQNHANYNSANAITGHFETPGLPFFTGAAPRDRVIAQGWNPPAVSEVATGGGSALGGVRQLWDAPYHRLGMMHPHAISIGWGHSSLNGRESTVADLAYDFSLRTVDYVRAPADRQTNIPTSWSGHESPNPLPAGVSGPVGYPIMVVYSQSQNVVMRAAEVVAPSGSRLPIYYVTQQFEPDYQVIIPQQPLASNTTYHVRFDITVSGVWVTNEWDFSTGSTISVPPPPAPVTTLHSAWASQTVVPALQPAATSVVTVQFRNTGTRTWASGVAGSQIVLGVINDSTAYTAMGMNAGWPSANRVAIQREASVPPGALASFTFAVAAPFAAGTVALPLRPLVEGVAWLEDEGVFVPVTTFVNYHSAWVSESAFPTLQVNQVSGPLSIVFKNTGAQVWNKGTLGQEARLGVNGDNEAWAGLSVNWPFTTRPAVQTEASVAPGANGTFTFQVRAPAQPGLYAIHLRPVIDGVTWMEDEGVFLYARAVI